MKPLKVKLSVTLDEDVVEKARELSEKDGRSLSQYINLVLRRHLERLAAAQTKQKPEE